MALIVVALTRGRQESESAVELFLPGAFFALLLELLAAEGGGEYVDRIEMEDAMHSDGVGCAKVAIVCALILSLCTACSATTQLAKSALGRAGQLIHVAAPKIDDVVEARISLKGIADEQFSPDDLKLRNRLLTSTKTMLADNDIATLRSAADGVDARYASFAPQLQAGADGVVRATLSPSVYADTPKFREEFEEVTAELVVDAACQEIFDVMVPDVRPKDPGRGSEWTNAGTQAIAKLVARRWTQNTFVNVVDWAYFAQSIGEQGAQLAASTRDAPDSNAVQLLARSPVSKALIQYLRLCYRPPRTVT